MPSCMRCLSNRLSVCLSVTFVYSVETNKLQFFHYRVATPTPFWVFDTNVMAIFRRVSPTNGGGVECRWVGKNRDSRPISNYRIDDRWTCEQQLRRSIMQFTTQTATQSESCLSQPVVWTTTTKRREEKRTELRYTPR